MIIEIIDETEVVPESLSYLVNGFEKSIVISEI